MSRRGWVGSSVLFMIVLAVMVGLAAWKYGAIQASIAASQGQPEPMESVTVAVAREVEHRQSAIAIGTVRALRSITLRNELAGTVREIRFTPGQIVEAGALLVALDVAVEEADLKAQQAQAALAQKVLERRENLSQDLATAKEEVDRARADLDVALAQIARTKAIIARKTIRAPFRARVGLADVHPGQYLNEGTELTTLQGVEDAVHVDFTVAQHVAATLDGTETVEVLVGRDEAPIRARIVALDARVDPATRNAWVRAKVEGAANLLAPGASVRVRVPVGPPQQAVVVPASAVRKGPGGTHVFVIEEESDGKLRARARQVEGGGMLGDRVVLQAGLTAGERVAASGSFKLRDGLLVVVTGNHEGEPAFDPKLSRG